MILYFFIWILFIVNGPFKIGEGLNKNDWLIFTGGYLSFVGTISITYMVIIQNKNFYEAEKEKNRLSQLPYFRLLLSKEFHKNFKIKEGKYLIDCPRLVK